VRALGSVGRSCLRYDTRDYIDEIL
jgi:hypothetical protein